MLFIGVISNVFLGEVVKTPATELEGEAMARLVPVIEEMCTANKVELSIDKDAKIEQLFKEKRGGFENDLILKTCCAHLGKNIPLQVEKIVKEVKLLGDSMDKIGNQPLGRLVNAVQTTVKKCCARRKKFEISRDDIRESIVEAKYHCIGDHSRCSNADKCGVEPILKPNGRFNQQSVDTIVKAIFDKWLLTDKTVNDIYESGSTSILEAFHALLVNRG